MTITLDILQKHIDVSKQCNTSPFMLALCELSRCRLRWTWNNETWLEEMRFSNYLSSKPFYIMNYKTFLVTNRTTEPKKVTLEVIEDEGA